MRLKRALSRVLRLAQSVLNPDGIVMFNATGSSEVHRTAAMVFPHAMRFANMMVGSRDPIQVDAVRWEGVMKRYVINGTPVVGEGEAGPSRARSQHGEAGVPSTNPFPAVTIGTVSRPVSTSSPAPKAYAW